MDLPVWSNTELRSFQCHPVLSYAAGYTGHLNCSLLNIHAHLDVLEEVYHRSMPAPSLFNTYIFVLSSSVMIISLQHVPPFLLS